MSVVNITKAIAVLGGLFSSAMTFYASEMPDLSAITLTVLFGIWVALPFGLVFNRARSAGQNSIASGMWLAAGGILAVTSFSAYWFTIVNNPTPDAQDGLVFLIIPVYQLLLVGLVFLITAWVSRTFSNRV